jgi:2,4-dienoyl-CoA reductase (NADPH2)
MLFSPITIKDMTLKNRVVMTVGGCAAAGGKEDGYISEPQADFLVRRARGGAGMIIIGVVGGEMSRPVFLVRLSDDKFIPSFQRVVERIHEAGAKVCAQLFVWISKEGKIPSPEDVSIEEMKRELEATAAGAIRAKKAGVDAIEFKCCHSTIMPEFLSRHWNRRTDEYGGNTEGRMKYPIEVFKAIRQSVGDGFPVGIRLGVDDFLPDGNTLTHTRIIARRFAELGMDFLNHSAGFISARDSNAERFYPLLERDSNPGLPYSAYRVHPVAWMPDGVNVYLGEDLRKTLKKAGFSIPVITAGKIPYPELAEEILRENRADLIGLLRPFLSDPDWAIKAKEGREKEIQRCRYCNLCLAHKRGEPALCVYAKE